jgi:hypothetical protein
MFMMFIAVLGGGGSEPDPGPGRDDAAEDDAEDEVAIFGGIGRILMPIPSPSWLGGGIVSPTGGVTENSLTLGSDVSRRWC